MVMLINDNIVMLIDDNILNIIEDNLERTTAIFSCGHTILRGFVCRSVMMESKSGTLSTFCVCLFMREVGVWMGVG